MKLRLLILYLIICNLNLSAQDNDLSFAKALVNRITPSFADKIKFRQEISDHDLFELIPDNGKLIISGNNPGSLATGFNYFLREFCKVSVSWNLNDKISVPKDFPTISSNIKKTARVKSRFFLNYCTFGYTMPWWKWENWERFIDWMALNGINLPLAITGQEKVWLNVWKKFGLSDEEIKSFFTGPAYLPWHRMANIDHWGGPLPASWIENQAELQKKILQREREFGMKPVLPAFAGHVPYALKTRYPLANISSLGEWGDFSEQYRSFFLDSFDPLFFQIQSEFIKEQNKLFGSDHIYGIDPFNEVTPPSWESEYLADVSANIFKSLTDSDKNAEWLQMTWIFFYMQDKWTNDRIKAFLRAVPQNKMILLDYFCENTEIWKRTDSYFGQPFVWCYLGNFGGNTVLDGNFKEIDEKIENTLKNAGNNLQGIGATLEGFGNNRPIYEFILEKAWDTINYRDFVKKYATSVLGTENSNYTEAWKILSEKIYINNSDVGHGDLTNSKPVFEKNFNWTVRQDVQYKQSELLKVWQLMILSEANSDAAKNDLTVVGKQVLGNYFPVLRDSFTKAYQHKDIRSMKKYRSKILQLFDDIDELLASNPNYLVGEWINMARDFGIDEKEKDYFETDARKIITVWGEKGRALNDYANRSIAGLVKDYYKGRWKILLDEALFSIAKNEYTDEKLILEKVNEFSWQWANSHNKYSSTSKGNTLKISKKLFYKYSSLILKNQL